MKEFADDNLKFDGNGGKLSNRVEITVEKGKIALHKKLLLSHSVFEKLVQQIGKNKGVFGKEFTFYQKTKF